MAKILLAALGILCASVLPSLPPLWVAVVVSLISICLLHKPLWGEVSAFILGASWGVLYGYYLLSALLPTELEGLDLLAVGTVVGLPNSNQHRRRFELEIKQLTSIDPERLGSIDAPAKVVLSWYNPQQKPNTTRADSVAPLPLLTPGEVWQLTVRLKSPRGFANPAGFDFQAWLMQRGIGATGYVRNGKNNKRLSASPGISISHWRHRIQQQLGQGARGLSHGAVLKALAIGDRSGLSKQQWGLLLRTGTNHLMAISGLHIGLLAALGYWLGAQLSRLAGLTVRGEGLTYYSSGVLSIAFASLYSALAGFSLSTQRALLMVLLVNVALMCLKPISMPRVLAIALLCVLVLSPLAGYEVGFWLTFGATGVLLFAFRGRKFVGRGRVSFRIRQLLYSQWVVFLGLCVPLITLGISINPVAPVANVVAIMVVSWAVVPPLLIGVCLLPWLPMVGWALVVWADHAVGWTLQYLYWCDQLPLTSWWPVVHVDVLSLLLGGVGAVLVLLPTGVPGRWLGMVCLLVFVFPEKHAPPALQLTVLDVGQGLAAVIKTPAHTLVYDTGPGYSERFDAGSGIIVPYLKSRGIHQIDKLIVSHADNDHSGGFRGLLRSISADEILWGEALRDTQPTQQLRKGLSQSAKPCRAGQMWIWDGVLFQILSPATPETRLSRKGRFGKVRSNDRSCVLAVGLLAQGNKTQWLVLPGDIGRHIESQLIDKQVLPNAVSVLIAPHHGSRTSSSTEFVQWLQPQYVVYSVGYGNRYGHPHADVSKRYRSVEAVPINTAALGATSFTWDKRGVVKVVSERKSSRRYWFKE